MQFISASDAKQNFGELLTKVEHGPVRILRHGKSVAALVSAQWLEQNASQHDPRALARSAQQQKDQERLDKHRQIALTLLTTTPQERSDIINQARCMVDRWQSEQLCSRDYIDAWRAWLNLTTVELAKAITSTQDAWAKPMRQNSPFVLP